MTERIRRFSLAALSLLFLLRAVANWFKTAIELRRFYTNMPIWDALDFLTHYARYKQFDLSVLWIQHNEHRVIGTELVYVIDMLFLHERQILPTAVSIAAYIGVVGVLISFAFYGTRDKFATLCAALLLAAFTGYKICVVSLTIPFLTQWTQFEFLAVAAIAAISLHKRRGGELLLLMAIAFAIGTNYSAASGMFVWPILLAIALLLRFTIQEVMLLAATAAVSIGLYFYHYTNLHSLDMALVVSHPLYGLEFLGSFLGMPFSAAYGTTHPRLAVLCGWLALLIFTADLVSILRRRLVLEPSVLVLAGFSSVMLISATVTAMGRMNPSDPYYLASRAGRYITEPILFWSALLMLTVWLIGAAWKGFASVIFLLAAAIFAAKVLPNTSDYYAWWEAYFQRGQWATIAMANGVVDKQVSEILFSDAGFIPTYKYVLIDNHLAIFADPEPSWIGRRAADLFTRGADNWIHGLVTTVKRRGVDYEIQGWTDPDATIIFVDDMGRVAGLGMRPGAGPTELYTYDVPPQMAFTGFIRGDLAKTSFSTYALDRRHRQMYRIGQFKNDLPQ